MHLVQRKALRGLVSAPTSLSEIKPLYQEQCSQFRLDPLTALSPYNGARLRRLPGRYFSILQSLKMVLCTHNVRKCIQWRAMFDESDNYVNPNATKKQRHLSRMMIHEYFVIGKKGMDGYSLKGKRSIQIATITWISIYGAENSTNATDVHYMVDVPEDRWTRMATDQQSDKEIYQLRVFGALDIASGSCVGVVTTQVEDSKSSKNAMGRGGAMSHSRLLWTRFGWTPQCTNWKTCFSPTSATAKYAHRSWRTFMNTVVNKKIIRERGWMRLLKPNLIPFAKSPICPEIANDPRRQPLYKKALKWMAQPMRIHADQQVSDWDCAESIRVKPPEPLHATLRIPIQIFKWYFLYLLEYSEWIGKQCNADMLKKNHSPVSSTAPPYHVCSEEEICKHFRECLNIPLLFDKANPSKSTIGASGEWHRKLWTHLEDAVICEHCNFRPFQYSPIEKYWLLLFVNLVETMVPMELVHHSAYRTYFNRYLKEKCIESDNANEPFNFDSTCVWQIYAQHFFTLFMSLLGTNRLTRYVHGLVYCTRYGFEAAHALSTTYRGLFGSDVVERMNRVTKRIFHTSSSYFGGRVRQGVTEAEMTFEQMMHWCLWDRYCFRELSPNLNLYRNLKHHMINNQRKHDLAHLYMAQEMRNRCHQKGYNLNVRCPLSNKFQRIGIFDKMADDAETDIIHWRSDEQEEKSPRNHVALHFPDLNTEFARIGEEEEEGEGEEEEEKDDEE